MCTTPCGRCQAEGLRATARNDILATPTCSSKSSVNHSRRRVTETFRTNLLLFPSGMPKILGSATRGTRERRWIDSPRKGSRRYIGEGPPMPLSGSTASGSASRGKCPAVQRQYPTWPSWMRVVQQFRNYIENLVLPVVGVVTFRTCLGISFHD